jgi:Kef-type K+ transport system membrane component KefB
LAVALLLGSADPRATVLSVGLVALVAWLLATVPGQISGHRAWAWLRDVVGATPATPLQLIYLLIVGLIALPRVLGVEILMGAILAGLVMRRFIVGPQTSEVLKHLEASYGLFVPLFFCGGWVASGSGLRCCPSLETAALVNGDCGDSGVAAVPALSPRLARSH